MRLVTSNRETVVSQWLDAALLRLAAREDFIGTVKNPEEATEFPGGIVRSPKTTGERR